MVLIDVAEGLPSFVTSLVSTSYMGNVLSTETALSVGIEPTSTTQNRRSQQRLFEYTVDLMFLTLASVNELSGSDASKINFSSTLASTASERYIEDRRTSKDTRTRDQGIGSCY